jgi:hypothetical protein
MSDWTPSIAPTGDQTVYLVLDDFVDLGRCWRETKVEATDLERLITDLLNGQYYNPERVIGFNTAEGWSRDVSAGVANELRRRCDLQSTKVPAHLKDFIDRHETRDLTQPGPQRGITSACSVQGTSTALHLK